MNEPGKFDRSVPLLIVKLGRYVLHHGAVGVARSLGRLGIPVYAVVEDCFTPLALSRYIERSFHWSDPAATPEAMVRDLQSIVARIGRRPVVMPTDDVAAVFLAEHQVELADSCIIPRLDPTLPRRLCNKREMHALASTLGVPTPRTAFPASVADVYRFIENAAFPVVIKAAESHRLPKGARSTAIAQTPSELLALYRLADNAASPNFMLQEYIPRGSEDWVFHGYRNPDTNCVVAFTGRKLRSWPPFAGPTTLGVCLRNEELLAQAGALLQALNYAGIMDLDYRLDRRDGQYKLLDFNPRIGANFRMFSDQAQLDVARALYLDLAGGNVHQTASVEGHKLLVESHDLFASAGYMARGALTLRSWWESLQGEKEMAWFSWDDPIPSLIFWIRFLVQLVGALSTRSHRRFQRHRSLQSIAHS